MSAAEDVMLEITDAVARRDLEDLIALCANDVKLFAAMAAADGGAPRRLAEADAARAMRALVDRIDATT